MFLMIISTEDKEKLVAHLRCWSDIKTDWPVDCQSQDNFGVDFDLKNSTSKILGKAHVLILHVGRLNQAT
jgi:hypothetical protein